MVKKKFVSFVGNGVKKLIISNEAYPKYKNLKNTKKEEDLPKKKKKLTVYLFYSCVL